MAVDPAYLLQGRGAPLKSIDWKRLRSRVSAQFKAVTSRARRVRARIDQAQTTLLTLNGFLFGSLAAWHTFGDGAGLAAVAVSSFGLLVCKDD